MSEELRQTESLMRVCLQAAVPLFAMDLAKRPYKELLAEAPGLADTIAFKGDVLQFKSKKKGETAEAFNKLARAIAILSFSPGGVTFLGDHYENKHSEAWSW